MSELLEKLFTGEDEEFPINDICNVHGCTKTRVPPMGFYHCPTCEKDREEKHAQEVELHRIASENGRINSIGLGRRFRDITWDGYKPVNDRAVKIKKALQLYAVHFEQILEKGTCLVLHGNPGTGKNHLTACLAKQVVSSPIVEIYSHYSGEEERERTIFRTVIHTTAMKLTRSIKSTWGNYKEDEQVTVDQYTSPDLLIIDEVGVQQKSQADQIYLTEVINNRYEASKPTIMIGNLSTNEFDELLGGRIIDRFRQGGGRTYHFDWESYRA